MDVYFDAPSCTKTRAHLELQTNWSNVSLLMIVVQHRRDKIESKWWTEWQMTHDKKKRVFNDICIVLMAVRMYSCNLQGEHWSKAEMQMVEVVAALLVLLPRQSDVKHARLKCRCPLNFISHSLSFWCLIKIANQFWNISMAHIRHQFCISQFIPKYTKKQKENSRNTTRIMRHATQLSTTIADGITNSCLNSEPIYPLLASYGTMHQPMG